MFTVVTPETCGNLHYDVEHNPFFLVILWSRMAFKRAKFIETTTFLKSKMSFSSIILPQFAADQFDWIVLEAQEQTCKGKKRFLATKVTDRIIEVVEFPGTG